MQGYQDIGATHVGPKTKAAHLRHSGGNIYHQEGIQETTSDKNCEKGRHPEINRNTSTNVSTVYAP